MQLYHSQAILIRRYPLSEKSWALIWMTQEYGKIKAAYYPSQGRKGAKHSRSSGKHQLHQQLFLEAEITFSSKKRYPQEDEEHFFLLKEATFPFAQKSLLPSYHTLLMASYFAQLVDAFLPWNDPLKEVFDLLERAFSFLREKEPHLKALFFFERELARALGIYNPEVGGYDSLPEMNKKVRILRKELLERMESSMIATAS